MQKNVNTRMFGCSDASRVPPPPHISCGGQNHCRGSGGKCDAPVATKYLIIATSFSGRLRLHLCVSVSVHDLEMKGWRRGLSALLGGGGGVTLFLCHRVEAPGTPEYAGDTWLHRPVATLLDIIGGRTLRFCL